jgi:hypothetical protein
MTPVFATLLALEMGDTTALRAFTAELQSGSSAVAPIHLRATAEVYAGYVDVLDGQSGSGVERIQRVLADPGMSEQAPGQEAYFLRMLLAACAVSGDARAGLSAADRMLGEHRGVRLWESEAHRQRAGFLAALGAPAAEVEAELALALDVARAQGAKLFERRALDSLTRHYLAHGDERAADEAREQLARLEAGGQEAGIPFDG